MSQLLLVVRRGAVTDESWKQLKIDLEALGHNVATTCVSPNASVNDVYIQQIHQEYPPQRKKFLGIF